MDSSNRRDFIKATAAIGVLGASEASAQPAKPTQVAQAGRAPRLVAAKPFVKIGFLHSTNFESDLEQAFFAGLRSTGSYEGDPKVAIGDPTTITRVRVKKRVHNGNYGPASDSGDLNKLGGGLHGNNVKLIIATGGMVAGRAAWSVSDSTRIFAIVGGADNTMPSTATIWNMNSIANNSDRLARFLRFSGLQASDVWLLFNSNSYFNSANFSGTSEAYDWINNLGGGGLANANSGQHNEDIVFAGVFSNAVQSGAKGIMVSSDPFFFNQRGSIITEAKQNSGLKMCYPNTEFWQSTNSDPNSVSVGPTLTAIYYDVGAKAAIYLADNSATITPDQGVLQNLLDGQPEATRR
jgi:hypothetical protein